MQRGWCWGRAGCIHGDGGGFQTALDMAGQVLVGCLAWTTTVFGATTITWESTVAKEENSRQQQPAESPERHHFSESSEGPAPYTITDTAPPPPPEPQPDGGEGQGPEGGEQ